jgi:hypothetical protein
MPPENNRENRSSIIGAVNTPIAFFALIALIVESMGLFNHSDILTGISLFLIFLLIVLTAFIAIKYPGSLLLRTQDNNPQSIVESTFSYQKLPTREQLYEKAVVVIKNAKHKVNDTTWGSKSPTLTKQETVARKKYRDALSSAIKSRGIHYYELFSYTEDHRHNILSVLQQYEPFRNYNARFCIGINDDFPIIDFLMNDADEIILSHAAYHGSDIRTQYIYIKSADLNAFFSGVFDECYRRSLETMPN